MSSSTILLTIFSLALFPFAAYGEDSVSTTLVRDGDIIFQTSLSSQSLAIQRASGSRLSHMGMILFRDGSAFVFEAVGTVRYTPLQEWIARGEGGHYVVKRLSNEHLLTTEAVLLLRRQAGMFEGKPYDLTFEWSDDRIYCSELVWKMYDRALGVQIGALRRLRDFRLDDPLVRRKLRERYKADIPLNEPVISPGAMFGASNLKTVLER